MIEYLNMSLNEAQRFSFKSMVNNQRPTYQGERLPTAVASGLYNQSKLNSVSPMRSTSAGIPKFDMARMRESATINLLNKEMNSQRSYQQIPTT